MPIYSAPPHLEPTELLQICLKFGVLIIFGVLKPKKCLIDFKLRSAWTDFRLLTAVARSACLGFLGNSNKEMDNVFQSLDSKSNSVTQYGFETDPAVAP